MYVKNDLVKVGNVRYKALWWTLNENPTVAAN